MVKVNTDIRLVKSNLRLKYRKIREEIRGEQKEKMDNDIYERVVNSSFFKDSKTLLCFVSTDIEVDTKRIILKAFEDKKTVAVPKCLDKNGRMDFFIINNMSDLKPSFFGLLEPDEHSCKPLLDYKNSVCILPGFAFDRNGYRIGYGKGYYDRFLQKYTGIKIGVCYNQCISDSIPNGRYDVAADYVVTQRYTMTIA